MTLSEWKRKLAYWLRLLALGAVAAYFGIIMYGALSITVAMTVPLKATVCCLDINHEDIHFQTADGLALAGWYVPSKNGAVIILLHTYYGNRLQTLPVAEMLTRHGYGVLMYDQRASGESAGEVRSLGWLDIPDVSQAVTFAQSRPGVNKKRIGVYGCSMGGAIALAAAAANPSIATVAADAASPLTLEEAHPTFDDPIWGIKIPVYALYYSFIGLRAGTLPPTTTLKAAQSIAPRPLLLISSGESGERERVEALYQQAGEPKTHWNIPESGHCGGPFARPDEYEQRLVDFFNLSLLEP
jgi:fermentation-respiration switch protein FrsA (DUF1100 family)